jgi:hypothetical protein
MHLQPTVQRSLSVSSPPHSAAGPAPKPIRRAALRCLSSAVLRQPSVYDIHSATQRHPTQVYVPITGTGLRTLADKLSGAAAKAPLTLALEKATRNDVRSLLPDLHAGPDIQPVVATGNVSFIDLRPELFTSPNIWLGLRGHRHLRALRFHFDAPLHSVQLHNLLGALPATLTHLELRGVCGEAHDEGGSLAAMLQAGPSNFPRALQVLSLPNNNLDCHDYLALVQRLPTSLQQLHFGANNPQLNQAALDCSTKPLPHVQKNFRPYLDWSTL